MEARKNRDGGEVREGFMAGPGLPGHAEGVGFGCERLGVKGRF